MAFDVEGARKAGYTDREIAEALAAKNAFDVTGARKAGYSDSDIIATLKTRSRAEIPGVDPAWAAGKTPAQNAPEPTLGEKAVGAGEAALSAVTGATGGALGLVLGGAAEAADAVRAGTFGTPQAADSIERAATQGAQALTYEPRTPAGQQYGHAVGQAVQQMIPVMPLTAEVGALAQGARPVIGGIRDRAAAVLDKAATELPPKLQPEAAPLAPQELGKVAVKAGEGGLGAAKAAKVLAEQAAPDAAKVAAAERLGISEYVQPDHVTSNQAYRQVVATIKSNPQSKVALAEREGLAKVAERASDLVDEIGGTNDLSALSSDVRGRMEATHSALDSAGDALYGKLREGIPARAPVQADNVLQFIKQRAEDLGGVENLSPLERSILSKLNPEGRPTYTLLDDVRKDAGAAARQAGPFKDADTGLAKKLYSLLSDDQQVVAETHGMRDVFDAARAVVAQRKALEDDLAALFGRNLDRSFVGGGQTGLRGAFASLAQGDSSQLGRLVAAVPKDMRGNVVASGLTTVFRKAATRGELDFTGFAKWYEGLKRNRQAYAAVMSNLPLSARKQIEALYRVSSGVSESLGARTKTGALNTIKAEMVGTEGAMEKLYDLAKRSAVGVPVEAVTSSVGLPGAGIAAGLTSALSKGKAKPLVAVDDLIASPEFAQMARAVESNAPAPVQQAAVYRLAHSRAMSKVVRALGNPPEMRNRAAWLQAAIRAPRPQQQQQQESAPVGVTVH